MNRNGLKTLVILTTKTLVGPNKVKTAKNKTNNDKN